MSKELSLSKRTLAILKNFATINPSMLLEAAFDDPNVDGGVRKQIRTASAGGGVLAVASIDETIPFKFPIMDLNSFLGILSLPAFQAEDCSLQMDAKKVTLIGKKSRMDFWSAAAELVNLPEGDLEMPAGNISAVIEEDQFKDFNKACGLLKHEFCKLSNRGGKVYFTALTVGLDTSNNYEVELGVTTEADAEIKLKTSNLLMMVGDYKIEASSEHNFAKFTTMDDRIDYLIGAEMD